jgi:hypothetical protein
MNGRKLEVTLGLIAALCIGCGGAEGEPGGSGSPDSDSGGGSTPGTSKPLAWAGTWDAQIDYSVSCDQGFGQIKTASYQSTFTVNLTGANTALQAQTDVNYYMSGTGNDSRLTLNGAFPLKGSDNQKGSTRDDESDLTVRLTTITDANNASGTLGGTFKSGFGWDCTVTSGTAKFNR